MNRKHTAPDVRRRKEGIMTLAGRGWRGGLVLLAVAAGGTACSGDKAESKQVQRRSAPPVAVATVERKTMLLQLQAIGTVEAYTVVSVRAQVGGEIFRVHVKEGQDVRKGDLLFTIDPRVLEAALAQAQANLPKTGARSSRPAQCWSGISPGWRKRERRRRGTRPSSAMPRSR